MIKALLEWTRGLYTYMVCSGAGAGQLVGLEWTPHR
jgi:hypothetical protein